MRSRSAEETNRRAGSRRDGPGVSRVVSTLVCVVTAMLWALCTACRTQPSGEGVAPRTDHADAAGILRATGRRLPGMRVDGFEQYRGEHLYDYMNGAADAYLAHHFRVLAACDVHAGSTQAKVELFEMRSEGDAAAVFAEFKSLDGRQFAVGSESRYWPGIEPETIFRRGVYFVRLLVYAGDAAVAEKLAETIASGIDLALQDAGGR